MNRTRNTNQRLLILSKKYIKLQHVPPPMPLEALLTLDNLTYSTSDGIGGGTSCNFIFLITEFYAFLNNKTRILKAPETGCLV